MYFQLFPRIAYKFENEQQARVLTDIIKRVKVRERVITEATLYNPYYVKDGETPDVVAANFYNDSNLHWIILHTNVIIDPYFGWPLSSKALQKYIQNKYPGTYTSEEDPLNPIPNYYAVHHYELISPLKWRHGMIMPTESERADMDPEYLAKLYDPPIEEIVPVTNIEYEESLNDKRRQIHVFRPELVSDFKREFSSLIGKA